MEKEQLSAVRNEICSRLRRVLYDRYGEFIPASVFESDCSREAITRLSYRLASFRSDDELLDLFEALQKCCDGTFGVCLFCRGDIELSRLMVNPLLKFCDSCERSLNARHAPSDAVAPGNNVRLGLY